MAYATAIAYPNPDFQVFNHGSIQLFVPKNEAARQWISDTAPEGAQYWGSGMVVETRYIDGVIEAAESAGFEVSL